MTRQPLGYPIPAWRVVLDGKDLTDRIAPRLIDLTLTECRGGEADQLDLRIHDHDGRMALPKRGVTLTVAIGWRDTGLIDKGTFRVDEVEHSGAPDIITIRARSADLTQPMRQRRERSWHSTTLGAVLGDIANAHGLTPRIAPALAGVAIAHLDQTGESDAHLLTRLSTRYDAVATVKAGALVFLPINSGYTAAGKKLPTAHITRTDGDQHRYSVVDRDASYGGVEARWHDRQRAQQQTIVVGSQQNSKRLKTVYSSAAEANEHAQAEWQRIQRGTANFSLRLALGRADLYPEQRVTVEGFKPEIDGTKWLIEKTTHTLTGSGGFTTQVEMETAG